MENYFILLELPFDLPESDTNKISEASLAPTASWNQLCEAADSMKKKILAKGDKTGRDNAVQSLCGLCVVIFKDVASKKKYDNYVNLTKYRAVNEAVLSSVN